MGRMPGGLTDAMRTAYPLRGTTMKQTVVIDEQVFRKGQSVFAARGDTMQWTLASPEEEALASAIRGAGARVVVIGAPRYRGPLYDALAESGRGEPALAARFGVGYDGVDLERCRQRGIIVTNTPGTLDQSVAEHAVALLLALARKIPLLDRDMRAGAFRPQTAFELRGKALGIAGFGAIGKRTALIAARGFGMKIHAFDSITIEEQAARESIGVRDLMERYAVEAYHTDFAAFARSVSIMSIHLPVTPGTRGFFSRERLSLLVDGALLVNTGRGALMDESALHDALVSGRVAGAALDVFAEEPYRPAAPDRDLRALPSVVLTPHVASNTIEANANMAEGVVANVRAFLEGNPAALTRVV
jgi:lactate dehydrogenase-like 2-hydroxyacid dehydrogenase